MTLETKINSRRPPGACITAFGERLKIALSQSHYRRNKDFYEISGISNRTWARMKTRETIEYYKIIGIAFLLGVNADWLSSGHGQMSDETLPSIRKGCSESNCKYYRKLNRIAEQLVFE